MSAAADATPDSPEPGGRPSEAPVREAPVREAHVEVVRTARYYVVGDVAAARTVWIALHGYGQLAGYFARHFAPHAGPEGGLAVVVPEALSRFYLATEGGRDASARVGATWMTREDRRAEIDDYVRYLDRVLDVAVGGDGRGNPAAPALAVLGFSQGAATACRWLAHRQREGRPPAVRLVLWGGALPQELDVADPDGVLRRTRPTLVVGDADEFATPSVVAEQEARLAAAGVPYDVVRFAGGHRLDRATLARVLD